MAFSVARHLALAVPLLMLLPTAQAADCNLEKQVVLQLFATKPSDLFTPAAAPVVTTSYRLGEAFDVKVGDVILRRQINPAGETASFADDVSYGSSLPFTVKYKLAKDQSYTLLAIPAAPDLRALVLPALHDGMDEYLFLTKDGQLCEHVLTYTHWNEAINYRIGSYKASPDIAATIATGTPDASLGNGTTLILNGIDAAAIDLSSRVAANGKMGEATHQAFDRSLNEIQFAGFRLKIESVTSDGLRLSVVGEPEQAN
ncbi:hypothetical protein [Solimonas terrae]|uniref:Uncharacterized protein n=1 Tax=Solimonas terrae TaxID=1396819 RepID=A0A6M2BRC9_9GAMM|nr:hypothetical protein [Solimonas terrae]NGY04567.1 hypothetical protein [Solimonas terrae]